MSKEPYSVTRDGRLIIRDIEAILERQSRVMDILDAIPDEDGPPTVAVEPPPKPATESARSRKRPGKAG